MKKKTFNKACAYVLIMALVSGIIPGTALAEGNTNTSSNESITSNSDDQDNVSGDAEQQTPIVLYELKDEREEKVKHFQ